MTKKIGDGDRKLGKLWQHLALPGNFPASNTVELVLFTLVLISLSLLF